MAATEPSGVILAGPTDPALVARTESAVSGLNRTVMLAAPLAPVAAGLMGGIVADSKIQWNPAAYLGLLIGASAGFLFSHFRERFSFLFVLVAGLAAGATLNWSRERVIATNAIERWVRPEGSLLRVRGTIASNPVLSAKPEGLFSHWEFHEDRSSYLMRVERVLTEGGGERPVAGHVLVLTREAVLDFAEGDAIEAFGRLVPFAAAPNPGSFDWRGYYHQQGVAGRLICDQRENIVRLGRAGAGWTTWFRQKARGLLVDDIAAADREEASLLEAMVLGHRSKFDRRLNEVFTRAGCVHFIAASGTNIIVLMATMWFIGRMVGLDKRQCAIGIMIVIALYVMVAEARPPILRASVMGLMFCASLLLRRPTNNSNWMCAAVIVLCLIEPAVVFDIGFQLSFAAVLGVAYLAPALLRALIGYYWEFRHTVLRDPFARADQYLCKAAMRFAEPTPGMRLQRVMWKAGYAVAVVCAVSLGAWLANLPLTALWFQRVQPWGVVSSVVVYPLMSAVMVLGLLKVAVAGFSPSLAAVITAVLSFIDRILIRAVEWMADLPLADTTFAAPPWWLVFLFYSLLLLFAISFRKRPPDAGADSQVTPAHHSGRFARTAGLGAAVLASVAGGVAWSATQGGASQMVVTVLSVGAGSAVVIELPDGETLVYDAGAMGGGDAGRNYVIPFLRYRGIRHVRTIHVSHSNLDHYAGVPGLIEEIPCGPVHFNHCFSVHAQPRTPARKLIEHLRSVDHPIDSVAALAQNWEYGPVRVEKLWPVNDSCSDLSPNESSTVLRLTYADQSILLTGDIEETAQRALLASDNVRANVLVLPHHGSVCSTTAQFVKEVGADLLVRSSGEKMIDTQNKLPQIVAGRRLYNTADCGAVTIRMDANGTEVQTWLPCDPLPKAQTENDN